MNQADMPIGLMIAMFVLYLVLGAARQKKKAQERMKKMPRPPQPEGTEQQPPQQKYPNLQEVLTEMHRQTEMKTNPYARQAPPPQKKKVSVNVPGVKPLQEKKKQEPKPFLTADYTPQTIEAEGAPSAFSVDYLKQTEIKDAYELGGDKKPKLKIDLRSALIAKVILDRPEWYA